MTDQVSDDSRFFPKWKYHRTGVSVVVKSADEEAALGEGWGNVPGGPSGVPDGSNPIAWLADWKMRWLSSDAQRRIRKGLLEAHAEVIEAGRDEGSRARHAAMKKAFDLFARECWAVGHLIDSILLDCIPQLVYDAAVSGGWDSGALKPNSAFTLRFGHYWVPPGVPKKLRELFEPQVWRWRAKGQVNTASISDEGGEFGERELIDHDQTCPGSSKASQRSSRLAPRAAKQVRDAEALQRAAERARRRQAVVNPILKEKRWTRGRLVTESGVGKATVYGYLDGTRSRISTANRQAVADALGLKLEQLPL